LALRLDDLEARFAARRARGLRRGLEITDEGLLLGAGTLLAGLALDGEDAHILALLSAAFACAVSPQILDVVGKAIGLWKGGEEFLAQLHLTYARLPPLTEEQAFALCAADEMLKEGMTPRALMKGLGLDPAALDGLDKYNPDQPRVPAGSGRASGRWGSGGSAGAAPPKLIGHGQALSDISVEPAGPTVQVAQEAKCSAFISEYCKGYIQREFPSEYLDVSVDQMLRDAKAGIQAAKKAKKLLFENRFRK
jgi:hypothetical protein